MYIKKRLIEPEADRQQHQAGDGYAGPVRRIPSGHCFYRLYRSLIQQGAG